MKNSQAFAAALQETKSRMNELNETRGDNWSEKDQKQWNILSGEVERLNDLISRSQKLEELQFSEADRHAMRLRNDEVSQTGFAKAMKEQFEGRSDQSVVSFEKRALNSTSGASLIGQTVEKDAVFAPLAGSVLQRIGVEIVDVENEQTKVAKVDFNGLTAINPYTEGQNITIGELSLVALPTNLTNRGTIIKVHNNLLRGLVTVRTENILMRAIAEKIQQELLYELLIGKANGFTGLDNIVGVQTVDAANAQIGNWSKFVSAFTKVLDYNGGTENISAVIPPVVFEQVQNLKDTNNQYLAPPPGLKDMKMIPCSIIKKDYGVTNNRTRVYLGDFSAVKILMEGTYMLKAEQRYLEEDVTAFRLVTRADMQLHIPEHIIRIENIAL